ncbi:hypothetical protein DHD05_15225 [Arenibacter sp. N53]|uniref:hypothetical protein n=1 Tax=Arenibacter TaxID=178469 RepID=UPI000CD49381|nr:MULTISPECIES: hypothetical protein [Arenibacter]MCM4152942.1 hypothetical protein [Arenibacter sp. N53]MCM4162765.1 hypothetical protein [Arenibacter sp. A80]PXX25711.1 hypothetical protein C7972_111129 [Arenibacter sp. ARW7G5Y1]RFT56818.1 hypothetical protein D0S24_04085 [Arenibacter sp. P308M17]
MEENLKVDKDYIEAFNLGYELAKELKLRTPMFKNIESGNSRMQAMQTGMEEYSKEITINKNLSLDGSKIIPKKHKNGDKENGNELSI